MVRETSEAIRQLAAQTEILIEVLNEEAAPLYGAYAYDGSLSKYHGKIVEYQADGDLRDFENVDLDPTVDTYDLIEAYVEKEVLLEKTPLSNC